MADETIVRNLRAPKEVFDRLAALTKDNGFANQGQAMEALMNAWKIQSAKEAIPEQRTAIEDFDSHVQAIQRAYLHLADLVQGAEARAMDTFRAKLEARDAQITDLRQKLEEAEYKERTAKHQQENALTSAMEANDRADTAKEHAKTLEKALEEAKTNAATQIEDKQRLIDSLTAQLAEAHEDARIAEEAAKEANSLKGQLAKAKQELTDTQTAATIAAAKATAERAEAVAAIQKETSTQLLKLTSDKGELQAEVERMKAQIATLETALALEREKKAAQMNDQQTPPAPTEDTSNVGIDKKRRAKTTTTRHKATPKTTETPPMNNQQDTTTPEN